MKGHGGDIRRALEALDDSIVHFQAEIDYCAQLRLGRIEENGVQVMVLLDGMATQMTGEGCSNPRHNFPEWKVIRLFFQ